MAWAGLLLLLVVLDEKEVGVAVEQNRRVTLMGVVGAQTVHEVLLVAHTAPVSVVLGWGGKLGCSSQRETAVAGVPATEHAAPNQAAVFPSLAAYSLLSLPAASQGPAISATADVSGLDLAAAVVLSLAAASLVQTSFAPIQAVVVAIPAPPSLSAAPDS